MQKKQQKYGYLIDTGKLNQKTRFFLGSVIFLVRLVNRSANAT